MPGRCDSARAFVCQRTADLLIPFYYDLINRKFPIKMDIAHINLMSDEL